MNYTPIKQHHYYVVIINWFVNSCHVFSIYIVKYQVSNFGECLRLASKKCHKSISSHIVLSESMF